jgi:hypothetical protein
MSQKNKSWVKKKLGGPPLKNEKRYTEAEVTNSLIGHTRKPLPETPRKNSPLSFTLLKNNTIKGILQQFHQIRINCKTE